MTGLTPEEQRLAADYGPPATHSDYRRGARITYRLDGREERQGEILWIAASDQVGSTALPMRLIVASDGEYPDQGLSGLDIVWPSEIIQRPG